MDFNDLKAFLESKADQYNNTKFIESDPIQVPHGFSKKEDIEIAGFLTATIAWGNRKSIITNANKMMDLMDRAPYEFVLHHSENDLESLKTFVHRTFNGDDLAQFVKSLQHVYLHHDGLESVFSKNTGSSSMQPAISNFKKVFFEDVHLKRSEKHISDPLKGSSAKRINMFLRWMVRRDHHGVDFGLWTSISPSLLSCPLDVHTGNIARKLGLLTRNQNDAKALAELDAALRAFDPQDPVKYDFALFGLGAFEGF